MGGYRYPGYSDAYDLRLIRDRSFGPGDWSIDDGTFPRSVSPLAGFLTPEAVDRISAEKAQRQEDEEEFELLMQDDPGGAAHGITDSNVDQYLKHRNAFFGSRAEYKKFAADADKELKAEPTLRTVVEYKRYPRSQTIFYRWVRKAYMNAGVKNVPALITSGLSEKLKSGLAKVSEQYGEEVPPAGFSPRPQKNQGYRYYLGTLSEHALGKAVDIHPSTNAIIGPADWHFIEQLCGKKVDRSKARWNKNPEALWQDVQDLNDAFVEKVAAEVKRITEERAKAAKAAAEAAAKEKEAAAAGKADPKHAAPKAHEKPVKLKEPIDEVLGNHVLLKQWINGFFTLEWELVEALHDAGFLWGVTFSNVDLHHFQLD